MTFLKSPSSIEQKSFEIIRKELGQRSWTEAETRIITRMIHTTADFTFADITEISPGAIEAAVTALRSGCHIVTDTNMAKAVVNRNMLERFGIGVSCFIDLPEVEETARSLGITRAMVAMRAASDDPRNRIFAVGNAPTALFELISLHEQQMINPAVVIGVPVGFVGATEAKEALRHTSIPYIITRGRKGGSNVAAAVVNALLHLASNGEVEPQV